MTERPTVYGWVTRDGETITGRVYEGHKERVRHARQLWAEREETEYATAAHVQQEA